MTKRTLTIFAALMLSASLLLIPACQKAHTGAVIGGVAGGVAGSQIGSGSGNTIATIAGVVIGAGLGYYLGSMWDDYDQRQAGNTFESYQDGQTNQWQNPNTGYQYQTTPTNTYQTTNGRYCREFTQTIYIDGRPETGYGTACRRSDGSWEIVEMD